jgi:carbon monoxide dehydrogenase subunit G
MKLEGEYLFHGPRPDVWELVRDPDALATAIPGTQKLTKLSDTEFEGTINLRLGPISGSFAGVVTVSNEVPPETCTLTVEGKGIAGFAKGVGHVTLLEQPEDTTLLKYTGELNIGGRLASVGQRLFDSVSKNMIRQGMEALDKTLAKRIAAKASGNSPAV